MWIYKFLNTVSKNISDYIIHILHTLYFTACCRMVIEASWWKMQKYIYLLCSSNAHYLILAGHLGYMTFWNERENCVWKKKGDLNKKENFGRFTYNNTFLSFFSWASLASPPPSMHCTSGHPLEWACPWACSHTCQSSPQSLARSHNSPLAHCTLLSPLGLKWKDLSLPLWCRSQSLTK